MLIKLFIIFFKIGIISYGGGYTIISLLYHDFVEINKWLNEVEFYDLVSIAQITPGPIAINSATFIGYKLSGVMGSLFSTFGVLFPSILLFILLILLSKKIRINEKKFLSLVLKAIVVLILITTLNLINNVFKIESIFEGFIYKFSNLKETKVSNLISFINKEFIITIIIFFINIYFIYQKKIKIKTYYLMFFSGLFYLILSELFLLI